MSDDLKLKERAVRKEYLETKAAFDKARAAIIDAWLKSKDPETDKRERLFYAMRALDSVQTVMLNYMQSGSDDIEAYIKQLSEQATTETE